ncbi:MAG: hypothetical protein HY394_04415 [Candidatus Diapherotrites archaeon]|nr:hypothetical protein [Candidatus Diapherotrites archaeon]
MFAKKLLALLFFVCLASAAFAFSVNVPGSITLFNESRDVSVKVFNDSFSEKGLEANFFSPFNYSVIGAPKSVKAQSSAQFTLRVYPAPGLENTYQSASLEVWLGGEKKVVPVTIAVKEKDSGTVSVSGSKPVTANDSGSASQGPASGLFSLGTAFTADSDLAVNLALVLIAAVLLIAFIARFTNRVA